MAKVPPGAQTHERGITLWKFARALRCTLEYDRDCIIRVLTDRGEHLSRRFKHESQAVAYAESLRQQMLRTQWTSMPVARPRLRGER